MSKLYQNSPSPYSLHKPPQTKLFHITFPSEFVVKYPKASIFFWIFSCRNSALTKTTDSCYFLLKKYLIVVNLSNITLSLNHSIMYVMSCCQRRSDRARNKLLSSMKTFLLLLTKSPNARNFCFSFYFVSFFRFFCFHFLAC